MKSANVFMKYYTLSIDGQDVEAVQCKIGDFGLSVQLNSQDEYHYTLCGTPNFLPPETIISHVFRRLETQKECDPNVDAECQELCKQIVKNWQQHQKGNQESEIPLNKGHSFPSDMWALGCIIYQLIYGRPPFEDSTIPATYKRIVRGNFTFKQTKEPVSIYCQSFIKLCLVQDINQRMTVEQAINHPWIQRGNAVKLAYLPKIIATLYQPYRQDMMPKSALNYTCSISDRIKQLLQQPSASATLSTSLEAIYQNKNQDQNKHYTTSFQEYLQTHYSTFIFLNKQQQLPNPLIYPPTIAQIDVDRSQYIDPQSILQFYDQQLKSQREINMLNVYQLIASSINKRFRQMFHPQIYTLSWIDFSNKYGFAYQLSTGQFGVLFNDESSIIISANQVYCDVIDLISKDLLKKLKLNNQQQAEFLKLSQESKQVQLRCKYQDLKLLTSEKKHKLVEYFKNYIENKSIKPLTAEDRDQTDQFLKNCNWSDLYTQQNIIMTQDNQTQIVYLKSVELNRSGVNHLISKAVTSLKQSFQYSQDQALSEQLQQKIEGDLQRIDSPLGYHFVVALQNTQMHIVRWTIAHNGGTLSILYNNKVFQVNFNDHVKIIVAHSIISLLNEKRQVISYITSYKKEEDFKFQEQDNRLTEAKKLYQKVKQRE